MSDQFITEFNRIMASTARTVVSDEKTIVNDMQHASMLLTRLMAGKDIDKVILKGGVTFQDWVLLSAPRNARSVGADPSFTLTNEQSGDTWARNWAKTMGYLMWVRDEIESNVANGSPEWRAHKYKDVWWQKRQVAHQTFVDQLEEEFVSRPNSALTETLSPTAIPTAAPFFAGVNEYNTGAVPYLATGGPAGTRVGGLGGAGLVPAVIDLGGVAATTFQGINPTTAGKENWRPYQGTYGTYYATVDTDTEARAALMLVRALSEAIKRTGLQALPGQAAPFGNTKSEVDVLYTSIAGEAYFEHLCLTNQDTFRGYGGNMGKDPSYFGPTMHGIPIIGLSTFGEVAFYIDDDDATLATTGLTELDTTGGVGSNGAEHTGPRYYGIKGRMAGVSFQSNGMFEIGDVVDHSPTGRYEAFSQYIRCKSQFWLRSRRQHFVLRPNGALSTGTA